MNLISAERIDARRDNSSSVRDVKYNLTGLKRWIYFHKKFAKYFAWYRATSSFLYK